MAPKLCWIRVPVASLAKRNMGLAMVHLGTWFWLSVPQLSGWRGQGELDRGLDGEKLRKGEGTEQKGRGSVCVHRGVHQEML